MQESSGPTGGFPHPFVLTSPLVRSLSFGTVWEWFGLSTAIPDGFILADGQNDTPDLRDRFVIGAGDTYNPDDLGGSNTHPHTFNAGTHFHEPDPGSAVSLQVGFDDITSNDPIMGTTDPTNGRPLFLSLLYLMKL